MNIKSKYIWMNGKLVDYDKATVHFLNPALHYGQAVFEGIRAYETAKGPAVFRLREHMKRLIESGKILGFKDMPYTVDQLVEATKQVVASNGFDSCYIRPLLYADGNDLSLNSDAATVSVGIAAWAMGSYLGPEALEKGIRANVSSYTRHHVNVMMTKAKASGNYTNSTMAKTESARLGFDEAIMLDPQGYVAECTGENLFLVRGNKLYAPNTITTLEGITRDAVIQLANDLGYPVVEVPISRDQMYIADEVFMVGTAAEVTAVCEIDFRTIGSGKMGPVTHRIQEAFQAAIHGTHPRSESWLVYVNQ